MQTSQSTLLTKKELATLVKTSVPSIDRWMRTGKIPYLKVGRKVLFDQEKVMAHLKSNFTVINEVPSSTEDLNTALSAANH